MPVTLLRPLCTVEEVRAELGNQQPDIADKIGNAINAASRFLERVTVRDWTLHDYTTTGLTMRRVDIVCPIIDGDLWLPTPPVLQLDSLSEDGVVLTEYTDFVIDRPSGQVRRLGTIWGDVIVFKGKLGYDVADTASAPAELPGDLRQGCVKIAASWTGENRREQVGFDGRKVALADKTIPKDAYALIQRYIVTPV